MERVTPKMIREWLGVTGEQFAKMMGVCLRTVWRWEAGLNHKRQLPQREVFAALEEAYGNAETRKALRKYRYSKAPSLITVLQTSPSRSFVSPQKHLISN